MNKYVTQRNSRLCPTPLTKGVRPSPVDPPEVDPEQGDAHTSSARPHDDLDVPSTWLVILDGIPVHVCGSKAEANATADTIDADLASQSRSSATQPNRHITTVEDDGTIEMDIRP